MSDRDLLDEDRDPAGSSAVEEELERLRELLLAPEQEQIRRILARLDDPNIHAREVGEILPGAISHSTSSGPGLERALAPTLENATRRAIKTDTKAFADALFPVMGPAIRKAIAEALRGLIQSLNQALEHSLSIRGLRWRLEALRTGRSFGEVVLSHTLVYRVEQIFLIHRETGLLLQHVVAPEVQAEDADMVSGMLTAIQDFVRDSFKMDQNETLQTMEVGDLQVWVEQGPRASLAAAVRGNAPVELRRVLRESLERIHQDMVEELAGFEGDASPFVRVRPILEDCLQSRQVEEEPGTSPLFKLIVGVGLVVILWWLVTGWMFHHRLNRLVAQLRAQPGLVVTSIEREHTRATVRGLRDPLAADPAERLAENHLEAEDVLLRFQGYQALHAPFILERATTALAPPPEITLSLVDGVLTAQGIADDRWRGRAHDLARVLPGVTAFDDSAVVRPDSSAAVRRRLEALADSIEAQVVTFAVASSEIDDANRSRLEPVVAEIRELLTVAEEGFLVARILIEGYADPTGPAELNTRLSRERAQAVLAFLVESGIPERSLQPIGRGTLGQGAQAEAAEDDGRQLRRVVFAVELPTGSEEDDR